MADSLTCSVTATFSWNFQSPLDIPTILNQGSISYDSGTLESGTSASQCDLTWSDTRSILTTANDDIDLTALSSTIFGTAVSVALAKLKILVIQVTTATTGYKLRLDSSVANSHVGLFGGSITSKLEIGASGVLVVVNAVDGWAVANGSTDILRISNPSAGTVAYKIGIAGTSA